MCRSSANFGYERPCFERSSLIASGSTWNSREGVRSPRRDPLFRRSAALFELIGCNPSVHVSPPFRTLAISFQSPVRRLRNSQKFQPLTAYPVMETAAADGES